MPDGSPIPATSNATSGQTEPEIVAGISSGEGQPAAFDFKAGGVGGIPPLLLFGAALALGFIASLGIFRR